MPADRSAQRHVFHLPPARVAPLHGTVCMAQSAMQGCDESADSALHRLADHHQADDPAPVTRTAPAFRIPLPSASPHASPSPSRLERLAASLVQEASETASVGAVACVMAPAMACGDDEDKKSLASPSTGANSGETICSATTAERRAGQLDPVDPVSSATGQKSIDSFIRGPNPGGCRLRTYSGRRGGRSALPRFA